MKLIFLAFCLFAVVYASVDDKTTPFAYNVAQAFNQAISQKFKRVQCPFSNDIECDPSSRYRTAEGTCNNLKNPLIGSIQTPFKRYLSPNYDDGFSAPRVKSVTGNTLPNPRFISTQVDSDNNLFEKIWSSAFVIFGQFLAHDIASTAKTNSKTKKSFQFYFFVNIL